jgi:hypothetical protein
MRPISEQARCGPKRAELRPDPLPICVPEIRQSTKSDLPSETVSSTLLRLELERLVKQSPGKCFVKLAEAPP